MEWQSNALSKLCGPGGVSRSQLAAAMGIAEEEWLQYEYGRRDLSRTQFMALSRFLNMSLDSLATWMDGGAVTQVTVPADNGTATMYEDKPDDYYAGANPFLLKHVKAEWREVLDVGCSDGGLGAKMKDFGIRVSGMEAYPEAAAKASRKLDHVLLGDIEHVDMPYTPGQFDAVVFGDVLEHLVNPWTALAKVRPYLRRGGTVLASVPNVGHISVVAPLLGGRFTYTDSGLLDKTHLRFFTLDELLRLFTDTGYEVQEVERVMVGFPVYEPLLEDLAIVCARHGLGDAFAREARAYQYIVIAKKTG